MNQKFPKSERLHARKEIEQLFSENNSFLIYPFKVFWVWRKTDLAVPLKAAFSIPKKRFKKASDRNLLKRRSREAYRKHKQEFMGVLQKQNLALNVMLVYVADNKLDYEEIQLKIILILQRLAKMNG